MIRNIKLQETEDENIKKIYREKMKPQGSMAFTSPEIGVARVRNEFHSYLVSSSRYHIKLNINIQFFKCL